MESSVLTKYAVRKMYHMHYNNDGISYSSENNGELSYAPVLKMLHCKIIHRPAHIRMGPLYRWKCLISDGTYYICAMATDSIKYLFDSRAVRSGTIIRADQFRIMVTPRNMKVVSLLDITPLAHGTTNILIGDYKDVNIIKMSDEVLHEI